MVIRYLVSQHTLVVGGRRSWVAVALASLVDACGWGVRGQGHGCERYVASVIPVLGLEVTATWIGGHWYTDWTVSVLESIQNIRCLTADNTVDNA